MTPLQSQLAFECLSSLDAARDHLKRARELATRAGITNNRIPDPRVLVEEMHQIANLMQGVDVTTGTETEKTN